MQTSGRINDIHQYVNSTKDSAREMEFGLYDGEYNGIDLVYRYLKPLRHKTPFFHGTVLYDRQYTVFNQSDVDPVALFDMELA